MPGLTGFEAQQTNEDNDCRNNNGSGKDVEEAGDCARTSGAFQISSQLPVSGMEEPMETDLRSGFTVVPYLSVHIRLNLIISFFVISC